MLARLVLSSEAALNQRSATGGFGPLDQLVSEGAPLRRYGSGEYAPGFELRLDAFGAGFWFEVVDKTHPRGFRYIGNRAGVIFHAGPIR